MPREAPARTRLRARTGSAGRRRRARRGTGKLSSLHRFLLRGSAGRLPRRSGGGGRGGRGRVGVPEIDEGLHREIRAQRASASRVGIADHHEILNVDDPRETRHLLEEEREVVVSPIDLQVYRPLRIEVLVDVLLRSPLLEEELTLSGQRLNFLDEFFGVARGGQDLKEPLQVELGPADLLAQLSL